MGGEIQKIEQDIVERVFLLGDRKISSLMTTRNDLTFLNIDDDLSQIQSIVNQDLDRIYPAYLKDKDNILGIIKLKDLFLAFQTDNFDLMSQGQTSQLSG